MGSSTSAKQIASAAVHGRRVTFVYVSGPHSISGYVCGQDDYHWLVAVPDRERKIITTTLVHKSRADFVNLSPDSDLDNEDPAIRVAVESVGRGFWLFCERAFFGAEGDPEAAERDAEAGGISTPTARRRQRRLRQQEQKTA